MLEVRDGLTLINLMKWLATAVTLFAHENL